MGKPTYEEADELASCLGDLMDETSNEELAHLVENVYLKVCNIRDAAEPAEEEEIE